MHYQYDGTFEGFLTVLWRILKTGDKEPTVNSVFGADQQLLFSSCTDIATVAADAEQAWNQLQKKLSSASLETIAVAFLSREQGIETALCNYILQGHRLGHALNKYHASDVVKRVQQAARSFRREIHRFKGLVRFRKLRNAFYYAPVNPKYDILLSLAAHFVRRMPRDKWLLHDVSRYKAVVWNQNALQSANIDAALTERIKAKGEVDDEWLDENEHQVQQLWRSFHDSVCIQSRANKRLQQQFMPKRYWRFLPEMRETSAPSLKETTKALPEK